ncbi:MAG: response regulator [Acidobacteriales bacterium]|nr:response regulator [Terriglobales bacterium]
MLLRHIVHNLPGVTGRRYARCVVLIDHDPADLKLFSRRLQKAGYAVLATGKADEALAHIVRGAAGCVVAHGAMTLTGPELVQIVRGVRSDIGVVFLSGTDTQSEPLPSNTHFVWKGNSSSLEETVKACMERWLVRDDDDEV